jgi:hypothetical protein
VLGWDFSLLQAIGFVTGEPVSLALSCSKRSELMSNIWIFSNNRTGYYEDSDWDTSTILKTKRYYFKESEPNRHKVKKGDNVLFREYGFGFWGSCEILGDWVQDDKGL